MSFGYDLTPWSSAYPIKDVLSTQAAELIEQIQKYRHDDSTKKRPLIFIADGIGCLILQGSLLQSHMAITDQDDRLKSIKLSTTGLILLRNPNLEASGYTVIPGVLETKGSSNSTAGYPRKFSVEDNAWLKVQIDAFQAIAECFTLIQIHDSGRLPSWEPPLVS